jgi:Raf kinase inhibitor-like YbhB/YbcL family protein
MRIISAYAPTVLGRTAMISVSALTALAVLSGCDTGDGKQLKDFDPADYPSEVTVAPTVESEFTIDPNGAFELPGAAGPEVGGTTEPFSLVAPWIDGSTIDPRHSCDGLDLSPALSWGAVPAGTAEIAIAMVDESAVSEGEPFVHWVIGGLDPAEIALVEGDVPLGALQALNFFGDVGYGGPCPPPGDEAHLYRITAYALNQQLELADGDLATEFLATIATISIASADVTGTYQR